MNGALKHFLTSNAFFKCTSLYFGYMLWSAISSFSGTTMSIDIPLCFYNVPQNIMLSAPESINVEIQGKKNKLVYIHKKTIAAHIDAQSFQSGPYAIKIENDNLHLPADIKVSRCSPHNIVVYAQKKSEIETRG